MMPLPPGSGSAHAMPLPGPPVADTNLPQIGRSLPPPDAAPDGTAIPMTADQMGIWWSRVERARSRRDVVTEEWQHNLDAYQGKPLAATPSSDWVNPNTDFADVEQKKAQLFFTTPEIHCTPQEPVSQGQETTILIKQAVLNDKLGPNGVDAKRVMDKTIFDVLCPAGWGATKIGYDVTTRPVTQQIPHPVPGFPPIEQTIDVPVYEEWFWEHFSPKKLLVPDDYYDNVFDKAPWLGMEFSMPLIAAKRKFKLPDDFTSTSSEDPYVFENATGGGSSVRPPNRDLVTGVEIWYRASLEDEDVFHPELLRKLVLIDGMSDQPATHMDSPYQSLDAQGRLTPDSMIGSPIHVLTIRDLSDSAYIRSDCSMTRDLVDQLSKFLTTQTKQRDTAIPMRLVDEGVITPEVMAKITNGDYGSFIPIPEGRLEPPPIVEIARAQYPRENFEGQARIERQLAKTLALDSNQSGATDATNRTATELTIVQNNASVRLKGERNRVVQFFLAGVRKFDSLLQRFATDTSVIQIVGPNGSKQWAAWNKLTIAGRWAYDIKPDSGVDLDEATARKQALDTYNFLGKDPLVDRSYLISELAPSLHLDPQRLKAQPKPPQPDRPTLGFSFKGEDLLNPLCVAVMIQGGVTVTPDMISQAHTLIQTATGIPAPPISPMPGVPGMPPTTPTPQHPGPPPGPPAPPPQPPHPGAMPRSELISEHAAARTGAISGAPNLPPKIVPS